ncbi:sigma-70 family RNA polymerase sigma factor [Nocardia sp. SYP-A9097]|uniref:RNA polymerase sigma factor n=1 Tax=Nocardia sp. SYP-A9097 TaxID=2663237 RepID=UPI00129B60AA|nr:sigma-70 family RNA polymerase sigma factor [Nocardia sp. SYP-A9097]MRH90488.1 sigma-70 family RNA polymerase sigma factor [Nocardia sp. SYP-A9097]
MLVEEPPSMCNQQGDPSTEGPPYKEKFAQFVAQTQDKLYRRAFYLCDNNDLAQDLVQEAYMRVYKSRGDLTMRYVITALNTSWYDYLRMTQRRPLENLVCDLPEFAELPETRTEIDAELHAAIGELPEKMQAVVFLHHYQDMKPAEIAHHVDLRPDQVSRYLNRARTKIRARLRDLVRAAPHEH